MALLQHAATSAAAAQGEWRHLWAVSHPMCCIAALLHATRACTAVQLQCSTCSPRCLANVEWKAGRQQELWAHDAMLGSCVGIETAAPCEQRQRGLSIRAIRFTVRLETGLSTPGYCCELLL